MKFSPKNDNHTYIAFLCMCSIGNKQSFKVKKFTKIAFFCLLIQNRKKNEHYSTTIVRKKQKLQILGDDDEK